MADLSRPELPPWVARLAEARLPGRPRPAVAAAAAVAAAVVLALVGLALLRSSSPPALLTLPRAEPGAAPVASPGPAGPDPAGAAAAAPVPALTVTVHVAGQVAAPGVYSVPSGARVADAVVAAGGTAAEADVEALNLAAKVSDGERVYVPRKGEAAPPPVAGGPAAAPGGGPGGGRAPAALVDLNTATAEQLEALPGVGPATTRAILAYRASRGRFRSVTELLEVPGIGPAKLEALRPLVRV